METMTEIIQIAGLEIRAIVADDEIYVPVKFFCEDYGLDFNQTMLWFNDRGYSMQLDTIVHPIGDDTYYCFLVDDFVFFMMLLPAREKKMFEAVRSLCAGVVKNNVPLAFINEIALYLTKTYQIPTAEEPGEFVTSSEILAAMPKDLQVDINPTKIGIQMRSLMYKKIGVWKAKNNRYGYMVVRI